MPAPSVPPGGWLAGGAPLLVEKGVLRRLLVPDEGGLLCPAVSTVMLAHPTLSTLPVLPVNGASGNAAGLVEDSAWHRGGSGLNPCPHL